MYTLYSTKKNTKKIQFMIMAMILYILHKCPIKTLQFPQSFMIEIRKLHHQIKKQNSMFHVQVFSPSLSYHSTMLQCTPKTSWKKSNLNLLSRNKI